MKNASKSLQFPSRLEGVPLSRHAVHSEAVQSDPCRPPDDLRMVSDSNNTEAPGEPNCSGIMEQAAHCEQVDLEIELDDSDDEQECLIAFHLWWATLADTSG